MCKDLNRRTFSFFIRRFYSKFFRSESHFLNQTWGSKDLLGEMNFFSEFSTSHFIRNKIDLSDLFTGQKAFHCQIFVNILPNIFTSRQDA